MKTYIGAIDQGTTSTRFILFDHAGQPVAMAQKEHRQIYPKPGWVEHDPLEIWENTQTVIAETLTQSGITPAQIAALGITNQRETTIIWDKVTGEPIHNALVWQDTRTASICKTLATKGGPDRFRGRVGLPIATYFSGTKIQWLLDNVAGARQRAGRGELLFGTIDTWLLWQLSGGLHVTDVTNASRTMLMNLETLAWDAQILATLRIPPEVLPAIRSSSEVYAVARGLLFGVPLSGVLGDQHAALFGQTCFAPGEAKNTYGTGCFLLLNTGHKITHSTNGLLTTLGYKIGAQDAVYALEGSVAIAGALVQWLRDNLGIIESASEIESLAASVDDAGGIYFVPAFSGLFAPHWRSDARGAMVGLTGYTHKGHLARAVLEATAFQTREVFDAMKQDTGIALASLKVDGGMVANELLMQFQSDILDVPVIRPTVRETTALGAAYAAGLAVGYWDSEDQLRANWGEDRRWESAMINSERKERYAGWKKAVTRTLDWA